MLTKKSHSALVQERLALKGWSSHDSAAVASKVFTTMVGPKVAFVYMYEGASSDPNMTVVGDYQSEGRNILETCGKLIPKVCSQEQAIELIESFARDVEQAISASYAVRLLRAA